MLALTINRESRRIPVTTASTPAIGRLVQPMFSSCKVQLLFQLWVLWNTFCTYWLKYFLHILIEILSAHVDWIAFCACWLNCFLHMVDTCMLGHEASRLVTRGPVRPEVPPRWSTWVLVFSISFLINFFLDLFLVKILFWQQKIGSETWSPEFWAMALTEGASREQFSRASFWKSDEEISLCHHCCHSD